MVRIVRFFKRIINFFKKKKVVQCRSIDFDVSVNVMNDTTIYRSGTDYNGGASVIGQDALFTNTCGHQNIAIGYGTLSEAIHICDSNSNGIFIYNYGSEEYKNMLAEREIRDFGIKYGLR